MATGSDKIRISFWAAVQPEDEHAAYYAETLNAIAGDFSIDVFADDALPDSEPWQGVHVFHSQSFAERHSQLPFDIHYYHIDNSSATYEAVLRQFLHQTGVVVLHHRSLLSLYQSMLLDQGYQSSFLDEVEYNYGLDTRQIAEDAIVAGTPLEKITPHLELHRRVVESALVTIVHSQEDHAYLSRAFPHKQIVYVPDPFAAQIAPAEREAAIQTMYGDLIQRLLFSPESTPWARKATKRQRATGVNFLADLKVSAGLGAAAMSLLDATIQSDVPVAFTEVQHNFWRRNTAVSPRYQALPHGNVYPINILCTNIHELHQVSPADLDQIKGGKYTIASWFWELSEIPDSYLPEFDRVDEIWVSSRYTQDAMLTVAHVPVHVIPCSVEVKTSPTIDRSVFGIPDERFVFLFSFSAVSCSARKNPWGVIDAFEQAFGNPGDSGPLLVLKAHHVDLLPEFHALLKAALDRVGGILIEGDYTRQQTNDLLACADAYISLHRAEGFGLGMAESMYLGKPVIGTAYSANTDFMTADNSYLVDYYLRPVTPYDHRYHTECLAVYEPGQIWAEPDIQHAAFWMRHIYENQDEARERGRRAAVDIRRYCSPEAVGKLVEKRLIEIERQNPAGVGASYMRSQAKIAQAQAQERYTHWANQFTEIEAPPSTEKKLGKAIAPLIERSAQMRFFARTYKRVRWLGHLLKNQHELNRANAEAIRTLTEALATNSASMPALQLTITDLRNQLTRLDQQLADPAAEVAKAKAEMLKLLQEEIAHRS